MKEGPDIARIAALIGDPARANMLSALMGGRALTASELAAEAGVTLPTASSHLAKLCDGGLASPRKQGRHKYFSLASDEVARVLEGLMGLAAGHGHLRSRPGPRDPALRKARVCYNHLAGDLGTRMFDSLMARGLIGRGGDDLALTPAGRAFVADFGIDLSALDAGKTRLCRECLDWSERRSHLGGSLGRALFGRMADLGWLRRVEGSRVVHFSGEGLRAFMAAFPAPD